MVKIRVWSSLENGLCLMQLMQDGKSHINGGLKFSSFSPCKLVLVVSGLLSLDIFGLELLLVFQLFVSSVTMKSQSVSAI